MFKEEREGFLVIWMPWSWRLVHWIQGKQGLPRSPMSSSWIEAVCAKDSLMVYYRPVVLGLAEEVNPYLNKGSLTAGGHYCWAVSFDRPYNVSVRCPLTQVVATSWAALHDAPLLEICAEATWPLLCRFTRFYRLNVAFIPLIHLLKSCMAELIRVSWCAKHALYLVVFHHSQKH